MRPPLSVLGIIGLASVSVSGGGAGAPTTRLPVPAGGRIEGSVLLSRALTTKRPRFRIYADAGPGSTPPSQPAADLKEELVNVVLYLELDPAGVLGQGTLSHPAKPAIIQRDERFVPHVLPIVTGTTVDFPNEDEIFHNVFSLSGAKTFDLPKYPSGASRSVTFGRPGVVHVYCHIHSDMSAVVLVLDNPYYIVPDSSGNFALNDVPAGDYTLVAWHERIKPVTQKIRIVAGQTVRANFNIPLPQPADR